VDGGIDGVAVPSPGSPVPTMNPTATSKATAVAATPVRG
jgi:hypothetical protein